MHRRTILKDLSNAPLDVADATTLTRRLLDFQAYYAEQAKPFTWRFTSADLKKRLDALAAWPDLFTQKTYEIVI